MAVVVYHVMPAAMPGGFVGVDVFFVISGYLITVLLVNEQRESGRIDLAGFYARRAKRLLPALLAMVLVIMLVMVAFMGRHESLVDETARSSVASLGFFSNFYFQLTSGGYFDAVADTRPMLHLWSLAVEEQFYLLYPLLLLGLLRMRPAAPRGRLAVLALASLLLAEFWVHIHPDRAFYQMPSRFWELAAGGLVALTPVTDRKRQGQAVLLPAGLVLVVLAAAFTDRWGPFPGKSALPAVVGASLILLGVHWRATAGWAAALLRSRPFVGLGLVSYSLYLWHWPMLVMADQAFPEPAPVVGRIVVGLLAVGIAWASWRWIEQPVRSWSRKKATVVLGTSLIGMTCAAGFILALAAMDRIPADVRRHYEQARTDLPQIPAGCHFTAQDDVRALPPESCHSQPGVAPELVLWGDSHAMAWRPFAKRLSAASSGSNKAFTHNSCPPAAPANWTAEGAAGSCARFNQLVLARLRETPPDTLVLALRWPLGVAADGASPPELAERVRALTKVVEQLPDVRRILVLGPLPALRRPAPECIALDWEFECARDAVSHRRNLERVWQEIDVLAHRFANVELLDPTDYFCGPVVCTTVRHDLALYWDTNHITASASRGFAEAYLADPARYTRRIGSQTAVPESP